MVTFNRTHHEGKEHETPQNPAGRDLRWFARWHFRPLTASAEVGIFFNVAPPEPRHEVVPQPRRGYIWSGGYWNARNNRHVWQPGHWERNRHGYYRTEPTWTQRDNRWQLERGRWNRGDRDGDGVPNRMDRAPNNANRQ